MSFAYWHHVNAEFFMIARLPFNVEINLHFKLATMC